MSLGLNNPLMYLLQSATCQFVNFLNLEKGPVTLRWPDDFSMLHSLHN